MNVTRLVLCATALALSACAAVPERGLAPVPAPAYVPSNSAPPVMTSAANEIVGPVWQWQPTQRTGEPAVAPDAPDRYTLAFQPGGRVNVRADCNRGSGSYAVDGGAMTFGPMALTKMGCPPDSKDGAFLRGLAQAKAYALDADGLLLTLADGAAMRFRPAR